MVRRKRLTALLLALPVALGLSACASPEPGGPIGRLQPESGGAKAGPMAPAQAGADAPDGASAGAAADEKAADAAAAADGAAAPAEPEPVRAATIDDLAALELVISSEPYALEEEGMLCRKIFYQSGAETIEGYVIAPESAGSPVPVIVYNRGGNGDDGALDDSSVQFLGRLGGAAGCAVFASQYREGGGSTGKDEFGGADLDDVVRLLDIADACGFVDASRLVTFGESRGSVMTYQLLRDDDRVDAAIVTGSVPDLREAYYANNARMAEVLYPRVGGSPEDVPEAYERRSAVCWPEAIDVPLLIFHTEDDKRASIAPVDELVAQLEALGCDVTYVREQTGGHCWRDMQLVGDFILEHTGQ